MTPERLDVILSEKPSKLLLVVDTGRLNSCLNDILTNSKRPEAVIRELWLDTFRSGSPVEQTTALVDELVSELPLPMMQELEAYVEKEGTPLILAREGARRQVETERSQARAKKEELSRPEKDSRGSKGWRKHIRREKAARRRSLKR